MKIRDLFRESKSSLEENTKRLGKEESYSRAYRVEEIQEAIKKDKTLANNFKEGKVSDLGALTFKTTQFKDELRTPHYEIQKSLEIYEEMPNVTSGINQIVLFITGNKVKITSEDEYTNDWYEKWMKQRPHLRRTLIELITLCEVCGNAYLEPTWDKKDKKEYLNDFTLIPDPSRVYFNLANSADLENEFWIYQVPYIYRSFDGQDIKQYRISYIKNGIAWQETVRGIPLKENELLHFKIGWSRYGYYGRSYLASTINSSEIITQILKNYAIASRFMAFGKKIFNIGDENDIVSSDELEKITAILNSPEDEEHIVINKKISSTEIAPTNFNEMKSGLDYTRREMSSGLVPNHMTPWAETVTYASSNNAKIPFELSLENKRNTYIEMLNSMILENVRKQNPKLKDATFEFGEVTLDDMEVVQRKLVDLYDRDLITINQMLKQLNFPTMENGDIFKTDWNALLQKKYQLQQSDVEQFGEPYMKREVKRDLQKDIEIEDKLEDEEGKDKDESKTFGESARFKESVVSSLKFIETDKDFAKEVKKKQNSEIEVLKTEVIKDSNIIRLCKTPEEKYIIFNNLDIIDETMQKDIAKKYYDLQIEKVKLQYEDYLTGQTEEDKMSEELFKFAKELQWQATKEFLDELKKTKIKEGKNKDKFIFTEKNVINPGILNGLDGLFDKFNAQLRDKISSVVDNLSSRGIEIIDDMTGAEAIAEDEKIEQSKSLIKDLIFDQFKTFNQNQSQNIKRMLTDGIVAGTPVSDMEQDLKDSVVDWKKYKPSENDYKVSRIASTEVHRASLQLKLLNWKNAGISNVKYITHMDDKVRPEHKKLHNRIFKIDDALGLEEWKEINCRCTMMPVSI